MRKMAKPTKNTATIERVADQTPDMRKELLGMLRAIAPEAFTEGRIDPAKLAQLTGSAVDDGPERFSFTWSGKRDAVAMLQAPSRATLTPDTKASVSFDAAQHIFIEGENLETLKVLYRPYFGRVKMIYIDPPYNTGSKEFLYPDNFSDPLGTYLKLTGQKTDAGEFTTTQVETNGRHHSSWLSMMYPRMALCRQFLKDDGVVFISIDDVELSNLLRLMDELYGEENRVGIICWRNVTDNNPTLINKDNEYIVCYARNRAALPEAWRSRESEEKDILAKYYEDHKKRGLNPEEIETELREFLKDNLESLGFLTRYNRVDEHGIYTGSESVHNPRAGGYDFEVIHPETKQPMRKPANGYRFPEPTFRQMEADGKIIYGPDEKRIVKIKKYLNEYEDSLRSLIVMDGRLGSYDLKRVFETGEALFDNPKPVDLLFRLVSFTTQRTDIVLDLFAGTGTTAEAVLRLNKRDGGSRRTIMVQMPEAVPQDRPAYKAGYKTIAAIGRARVQKVIAALNGKGELGLRCFRMAETNMRRWAGVETKDADAYADQLDAFADTLVDGWKPENVIWEVALREGYALTSQVEKRKVEGQTIWRVTDPEREQSFHICLDDSLSVEAVRALGLKRENLFICRDKALDDTLAANLALQCRLKVL
jgi:adenine-specific DNA-methyltransferase